MRYLGVWLIVLAVACGVSPARAEPPHDARNRAAIMQLQERIAELNVQYKSVKDELNAYQQRTHHLPPDASGASAAKVRDQLQMLSVDRAALEARRDAIAKVIEELTKKAVERTQDDPVARELESLVKLQEEQLATAQATVKTGAAPQSDLRSAESALAEARVKLLERREAATRAVTGDALDEMNKWLLKTTIDLAESQARAKALEALVQDVDQTAEYADRQRELSHELDLLQSQMDQYRMARDALQAKLETQTTQSTQPAQ